VIDHIGIQCADYPKSRPFYGTVLAVLEFSRQRSITGDPPRS
jgi:catechol 2,3-dioxygenase-like lactoylglutathione lyase family enzyme